MGPSGNDVVDQAVECIAQAGYLIRCSCAAPPAVAALGHEEKTKLCHDPDDASSQSGRNDQTGDSAKSGLGDGGEGILLVSLAGELDGLECADIASDKGKDGDTNATLNEDSEKGKLQQSRCSICSRRGREEIAIKSAGNVRRDNQRGCETAKAL